MNGHNSRYLDVMIRYNYGLELTVQLLLQY